MRATENLELDHEYIIQLTEVMESMTQLPELNPMHIQEVVDLIRNYADGLHHAKEENLYFPLMVDRGFPMENGPIAVMLYEHNIGRGYVKSIVENISKLESDKEVATSIIKENMLGYANLLQEHIHKENNILYKMADKTFTEADQEYLRSEFSKLEDGENERAIKETYIEKIRNLVNLY